MLELQKTSCIAFEMAELSQLGLTWLGTVQTHLHSFPNTSYSTDASTIDSRLHNSSKPHLHYHLAVSSLHFHDGSKGIVYSTVVI